MFEAYFIDLGWLLFALFFGVAMGSMTGLIPGFHVNNVALILLALSPIFLDWGIPLSSCCDNCFNWHSTHFPELYSFSITRCTRWRYSVVTSPRSQNAAFRQCSKRCCLVSKRVAVGIIPISTVNYCSKNCIR